MKNFSCLFALAITMFILVSCDDGSTNGEPNVNTSTEKVISLKVGNIWNYKRTRFYESGSLEGSPENYSMQILRDSTIKGLKTSLYQNRNEFGGYVDMENGLYRWEKTANDTLRLILICKYPIVKGDSYELDEGIVANIEDVNKKISAPAGEFKCVAIKVTLGFGDYYDYFYYCRDIGLIKSESWCKGSSGQYYMYKEDELLNKNF